MSAVNPLVPQSPTPAAGDTAESLTLSRAKEHMSVRAQRWKTIKGFFCRIDVCWTFFFFLFLVCVAAITTAITQGIISTSLMHRLQDAHRIHITTLYTKADLGTNRVFNMAAGFLTLHSQRAFQFKSQRTLSTLCTILRTYDNTLDTRSLAVTSLELKEAISCMHGDPQLGSLRQMYGWITNSSMIPGVYLINNTTLEFDLPLKPVYGGWPQSVYNLSDTFTSLLHNTPVFKEAAAYFNGTIKYIDYRTMWRAFPTIPHIIYCTIPAGFLFRGLNLPPNINVTDYVDVRVNGAGLLTAHTSASLTNITAAIFINASLTDKDPLVMSNNWGQPSVNDTEILATYEEGQVKYLPVSNISDPLMRAALKHVSLKALQAEGYNRTVDFQYRGAPARVTAATLTTTRGLVLPMVFVSSNAAIAMPYRRIMNICNGVTAVVIVAFTALFWWFINRQLRHPLQRISMLLLQSVKHGTRALFHHDHGAILMLTEVHQLGEAHNNAMRQLREIDTFIPEAVRQDILLDNANKLSLSLAHSQISQSLRASMRAHAKLLLTHLSTVVYISIRPSPTVSDATAGVTLRGDTDNLPQRQRLAAVVANAARAGEGANTWPFPTSAALDLFARQVHKLCKVYHGTVHRLCPDGCLLHFNTAVRERLYVAHGAFVKSGGGNAQGLSAELHRRDAAVERDEKSASKQDAKNALNFALALQEWMHVFPVKSVMDVRFLVDTSTFTCGHYRAQGSSNTLTVALGRDVQREVGNVPAKIGVCIAMTEETARCVRAGVRNEATGEIDPGVRQLPVEALQTGRVGLDADVVVLYEVLPGSVLGNPAWQRYQQCCFDGFSFMVRGEYAAALQAFKRVAEISDLEPGLMPVSLRREAAHSDVVGGATSVQVERLMRECVQRIGEHTKKGFCRIRMCPLGIDTVLKGAVRRSSTSPKRGNRTKIIRCEENEEGVAKREGRYGLEGLNATFTRTELRYVTVLPGTDIRTSYTGWSESVTDNWGTRWAIAKKNVADRGREMHDSLYSGLSETGNLCSMRFFLYRDVPPLVSKALRGAVAGAMTDAMRSAVPVWQPTSAQRTAVRSLFDARLRLRHPHLLTCLGYTMELEGGVVAVHEYCKGGNLHEVMARYDRLRLPLTFRTALGILLGLRYLHANGIVHGELRPECVLVCSDGACRLKGFYTDYVLAHRVLCLPRTCYVSPEVAAGQPPTPASDVFGYGLVMLELATQKLPWAWAPVVGEGPQRCAEDLAVLAAAGGDTFSALVVQGKVVPGVSKLDSPEVVTTHPAAALVNIRACLSIAPLDRITVADLLRSTEKIVVAAGMKMTLSHHDLSSTSGSESTSVLNL
ncbi:protein kinase-like protein [Lotmaria passim]